VRPKGTRNPAKAMMANSRHVRTATTRWWTPAKQSVPKAAVKQPKLGDLSTGDTTMIVRLVKGIALIAAFAMVLAAMASPVHAGGGFAADVPEIGSGTLLGAIALLSGGVLVVKDRLRRR
jgi:hypothetical protein